MLSTLALSWPRSLLSAAIRVGYCAYGRGFKKSSASRGAHHVRAMRISRSGSRGSVRIRFMGAPCALLMNAQKRRSLVGCDHGLAEKATNRSLGIAMQCLREHLVVFGTWASPTADPRRKRFHAVRRTCDSHVRPALKSAKTRYSAAAVAEARRPALELSGMLAGYFHDAILNIKERSLTLVLFRSFRLRRARANQKNKP